MWKDIIGTVAPTLATALGGPLVGMAVGSIGKALGFDDASEDDIAKSLKNPTSEQLLALKNAEQDFLLSMRKLDVDLERIHADDRNSARKRESDTGDVWTPRVLAAITMFAFVGCIYLVFSEYLGSMSPAQLTLVGGVVGYASAKADTVIGYYFGSSSTAKQMSFSNVGKGKST